MCIRDRLIKIPGLDGSGKMGKSEGNCIYLDEDAKSIEKKVKRALTDEGPKAVSYTHLGNGGTKPRLMGRM